MTGVSGKEEARKGGGDVCGNGVRMGRYEGRRKRWEEAQKGRWKGDTREKRVG